MTRAWCENSPHSLYIRFARVGRRHRPSPGPRHPTSGVGIGLRLRRLRAAALGTIAIPLPDGRSVQFRGVADRGDVSDDDAIHDVDDKTVGSRGYGDLSEIDLDATAAEASARFLRT